MSLDYSVDLPDGKTLEYYDEDHSYLVDGVLVPSITEIVRAKTEKDYSFANSLVLKRAAERGTAVHEAIENWCKFRTDSPLPELRNFRFLEKQFRFEVVANEVPVVLSEYGSPVAAGRCDLVLRMDGVLGLADIKRTATLDKTYLSYQLNLYAIAYMQTYNKTIEFLRGIHLRDDLRKFVTIPQDESAAWEAMKHFREVNGEQSEFDRACDALS